MRVQIATRHCEVPDPVLERTRKQLERLRRYDPRISSAEVTFTEEKRTREVEVVLHVDRTDPVVARGQAKGFRAALTKAVDRLSRQVRDQRDQHTDHQAPPFSEGVVAG